MKHVHRYMYTDIKLHAENVAHPNFGCLSGSLLFKMKLFIDPITICVDNNISANGISHTP